MAHVTTLDDARLLIALSAVPVLIRCGADCSAFRQAATRLVDEAAAGYEGRVTVLEIGAGEAARLARQHNLKSVPALVLFSGGEAVARLEEDGTPDALPAFLDAGIGETTLLPSPRLFTTARRPEASFRP